MIMRTTVNLDDELLRRAKKRAARQGRTLSIQDDWLLLQTKPDAPFTRLMPLTAPQISALNCFDGQHTIADICSILESEYGFLPEAASDLIRTLFVALAEEGLCHPLEPPE